VIQSAISANAIGRWQNGWQGERRMTDQHRAQQHNSQ
jgi:hypothetical protein